jgi:hypothetical protein
MNGPAAAVIGLITARGRSGGGGDVAFAGLFPAQGRSDWPHGVQESDAPRFAVEHAAALRSAADEPLRVLKAGDHAEDGPQGDIVDLFNRRLR